MMPFSQVPGAEDPALLEFLPQLDVFSQLSAEEWTDANIKTLTAEIVERNAKESFEQFFGSRELDEVEKAASQKKCLKVWLAFVHGYVRWAIFAKQPGPDGAFTMRLLGREESLKRFEAAKKFLSNKNSTEAEEDHE